MMAARNVQPIPAGSVGALLFDLGGVVIDVNFDLVFSRWATYSHHDVEVIKSRFSFDDAYKRHERGEIGAPTYFDSLRRSLGIDISDAQFEDGWNAIYVGEVPGIATLLARANARLPLYAFTNSNPTHQRVWSKRFSDVLGLFHAVFVSSELGMRKPEPESFRAVARTIGMEPHRIVCFDDSMENVAGARSAGLRAVHVTSLVDIEESLREILA